MMSEEQNSLLLRLEAMERELRNRREVRARIRASRNLFLRVTALVAVVAACGWVLGQGVEVQTTDTASQIQRFRVEPGTGVGVDSKAYFVNSNLGIGTTDPQYRDRKSVV